MALTITQLKISNAEYAVRCEALLAFCRDQKLSGIVLFDADYIKYYCGFAFIPTERPMAFVMNARGERAMFVPRLEVEHAQANALIERVDHYLEYPADPHPATVLAAMLRDMGIQGSVGADHDGYPWVFGYRGPSLTDSAGVSVQVNPVRVFIEEAMMIKSPAEIALLAESCKWGNLAHVLLQRYTVVGATETEVTQRASDEATRAMYDAIGPLYRAQSSYYNGAIAGYRGQIGRNAAIPHALANNIVFQPGDVLVTGASAPVWGYVSELERTMFLGKPTDDQRRMFDHMVALQDLAMNAIEPGKPCSAVDLEVRAYYDKHDLMPYWKHHVGHAIGLRYHEAPFLDKGDHTIIQPGMVFTVEPGLYAPALGGYRHSDTVLVTEQGTLMMTYYPRDIDSLTLPI
ncbi:MAG: Xaa-Pro peptidase family protein [Anaerolineae bacterium]